MTEDMIKKAIKFATIKHEGQFRKVSGLPYITHPLEVYQLVSQYKTSKKLVELQVAAICHDLLQDTDTTFIELASEFSPLVASLVLELTSCSEQIKLFSKVDYLKRKMVGMSNYGLYVKLCDRLSNIKDHPTKKAIESTKEILDFLKENRQLSNSQLRVITEIEKYLL